MRWPVAGLAHTNSKLRTAVLALANCIECVAGYFDDDTEVCAQCSSGFVQPTPAQTSCIECVVDFYDDGSETCAACPAGQNQPSTGQTECVAVACPDGSTGTNVASGCTCDAGSTGIIAASSSTPYYTGSCVQCAAGFADTDSDALHLYDDGCYKGLCL